MLSIIIFRLIKSWLGYTDNVRFHSQQLLELESSRKPFGCKFNLVLMSLSCAFTRDGNGNENGNGFKTGTVTENISLFISSLNESLVFQQTRFKLRDYWGQILSPSTSAIYNGVLIHLTNFSVCS